MEWKELKGILLMAYDSIELKLDKVCIVKDKKEYHLINIDTGDIIIENFFCYKLTKDGYIVIYNRRMDISFIYNPLQNKSVDTAIFNRSIDISWIHNPSQSKSVDIAISSNRKGKLIDRVVYNILTKTVQKIQIDDFTYIHITRRRVDCNTIQDTTIGTANYDMNYTVKLDILGGVYNKLKKILKMDKSKEDTFIWNGKI